MTDPSRPAPPDRRASVQRVAATAMLAVLALLSSLLLAPAATAAPAAATGPLQVGTWNTDLVGWVGNEQEVLDTVAATRLDVLGLQGVWTTAAASAITTDPRIAAQYPYSSYDGTDRQAPGSCVSVSRTDQENFINAVIGLGASTTHQAQTPLGGAQLALGLNITLLSQPCSVCLLNTMAILPEGQPALQAIDRCAAGTGVRYGFAGHTGQLVLSRTPITDLTTTEFDSSALRRANVYATIGGLRFGFVSWAANSIADIDPDLAPLQTGALQPEMAQDVVAHSPDVLLGTTNTSPGYQPEGFQVLTDRTAVTGDPPAVRAGAFYDPAFDQATFCPQATHSGAAQCASNVARFLAVPPRDIAVDNAFESDTTVCTPTGTFGTRTASDHIGLTATCSLAAAPTVTGTAPAGVPNAPYSYTFTLGGNRAPTASVAGGTVPPGLSLSASGVLSGTPTTVGTYAFTVRATNKTGSADLAVTVSIAFGAPATVTATGGAGQSAALGQPFGTRLTARVTDSVGNALPGTAVTFTVTAGSATFTGGTATATVTTDATGTATAPVLTAGRTAGPVTVRASSGAATPATYALSTSEARADVSVSVSAPATAARNGRFTVTLTVRNAGPQAATLAGSGILLPSGLQVVSAPGGAVTNNGRAAGFVVLSLAPGASKTYAIVVSATGSAGSRTITAAAASITRDPSLANNAAQATIRIT